MLAGGNDKMKQHFQKYKISESAPAEFKFKTEAAHYYRQLVQF